MNQVPILKLAALAKLTRRQTDVLRHIADTAGRGEYRDGAADIAAALKISRSTATAHIRRLEAARVLRHTGTDTTRGAGSGRHVYRVNWPLIEAANGLIDAAATAATSEVAE